MTCEAPFSIWIEVSFSLLPYFLLLLGSPMNLSGFLGHGVCSPLTAGRRMTQEGGWSEIGRQTRPLNTCVEHPYKPPIGSNQPEVVCPKFSQAKMVICVFGDCCTAVTCLWAPRQRPSCVAQGLCWPHRLACVLTLGGCPGKMFCTWFSLMSSSCGRGDSQPHVAQCGGWKAVLRVFLLHTILYSDVFFHLSCNKIWWESGWSFVFVIIYSFKKYVGRYRYLCHG